MIDDPVAPPQDLDQVRTGGAPWVIGIDAVTPDGDGDGDSDGTDRPIGAPQSDRP
jgi:hypothetical protein